MGIDIITVSSKGQVVLPSAMRKKMSISEGDKLATYMTDDMIILKRIDLPSIDEFKEQLDKAKEWAASVDYKEEDVDKIIKSARKKKREP